MGGKEEGSLEYPGAEKGGIAITLFLSLQANSNYIRLSLSFSPSPSLTSSRRRDELAKLLVCRTATG